MIKLITGIVGLLIILACAKDEISEVITPDDENHISITGEGLRDGEVLPILFMGSLTIWDANTKTQTVLNRDSIKLLEFAKIREKLSFWTAVPQTGQMFKAAQFRVIIHWKNGKTDFSGLYAVKDTSKTLFSITNFSGSNIGYRHLTYVNQGRDQSYYDYRYLRFKKQQLYNITSDDTFVQTYLSAWHHPASNVFFLDHKN